jgi:protease-4
MLPDLSGPMNKLGLTVDGVGTTPLSGGLDLRRPLDPQVASVLQQTIEFGYKRFMANWWARAARWSPEAVDQVAQGRVWLGSQAKEKGLVDKLGGLDEAIKAAASRANLKDYDVSYVEKPLSPRDQLLSKLLDNGEEHRGRPGPGVTGGQHAGENPQRTGRRWPCGTTRGTCICTACARRPDNSEV